MIGKVDNFFTGVIDEVTLFDYGMGDSDAAATYTATATAGGATALYLFNGNADDASGTNHGVIAGATSVADRTGIVGSAYAFDGIDDVITVNTPYTSANDDFSLTIWLKPTLMNDNAWHGFLGYQGDGTRSPSLWINFNGCDIGFCDCSGDEGGITAWSGCDGGPYGGACILTPNTDMPEGE